MKCYKCELKVYTAVMQFAKLINQPHTKGRQMQTLCMC